MVQVADFEAVIYMDIMGEHGHRETMDCINTEYSST